MPVTGVSTPRQPKKKFWDVLAQVATPEEVADLTPKLEAAGIRRPRLPKQGAVYTRACGDVWLVARAASGEDKFNLFCLHGRVDGGNPFFSHPVSLHNLDAKCREWSLEWAADFVEEWARARWGAAPASPTAGGAA